MARVFFGYGRWEAPYWFIGPEQGMGKHENHDVERSLRARAKAWRDLGSKELTDCREYHGRIGELRWHYKQPVALQRTWNPLMLLMFSFLERPTDDIRRRRYQASSWGACQPWTREPGETCVIELSGLAAPSLQENLDDGTFLQERIQVVSERLRGSPPRLVVMYGRMQIDSWNTIAMSLTGNKLPTEDIAPGLPKTNVLKYRRTTLVCTPAPSRPIKVGEKYVVTEYWTGLGQKLRDLT